MYSDKNENIGTANANPNTTTPPPDANWLDHEIWARRIPVPPNATPAQVIPWAHKFIKRHLEIGTNIPLNAHSYPAWKAVLDDWKQFLQQLENGAKIPPAPDPEKTFSTTQVDENSQTRPSEHDPEWTASGQKGTTGVRPSTNGGQQETAGGQQRPDSSQPTSDSTPSPQKGFHCADTDTDQSPNDDDEDENFENEDDLDDDDQDEADLEAQMAGYENDEERMAEVAEDFKSQLSGRNRFDSLAPNEQAAIIALLANGHSLRATARLIAQPPPRGLNFKISKSGLAKFRTRYTAREAERRKTQNAQAAADLLDQSEDPDKAFQNALDRVLKIRLLTTASEPNAPLPTIDALATTFIKLRKQSLAERKQLHAEKTK